MRRLLTRIALVAAGLLAVELGLRVLGIGSRAEVSALLDRIEGWREPVSDDEVAAADEPPPLQLDPFLGFSPARLGWRLTNQATDFTDHAYDIAVVGGSVAVGLAYMAAEDLELVVAADPRFADREVRVVNLARGAFKQPQQLHLVSMALTHGWKPDAVINLDGFNELAISVQNALDFGIHPFWPSFPLLGPLLQNVAQDPELRSAAFAVERERERARELAEPQPLGLHRSAVTSVFVTARMRSAVRRFETARDDYLALVNARASDVELTGPPFEPTFEAALELAVRNWSESSRSLHAICESRGIAYLHVLQPTLHDEGSKPLTPAEVAVAQQGAESWIAAAREGYPLLRAEGARLRDLGLPFHDASQIFAEDERTLYYDICHFHAEGVYMLAADIGQALLDSLR